MQFVSRYELLIILLILCIIYIAVLTICIRHLVRNSKLSLNEKKKWIWHLIHWNIFAMPFYWKKHMLVRKH